MEDIPLRQITRRGSVGGLTSCKPVAFDDQLPARLLVGCEINHPKLLREVCRSSRLRQMNPPPFLPFPSHNRHLQSSHFGQQQQRPQRPQQQQQQQEEGGQSRGRHLCQPPRTSDSERAPAREQGSTLAHLAPTKQPDNFLELTNCLEVVSFSAVCGSLHFVGRAKTLAPEALHAEVEPEALGSIQGFRWSGTARSRRMKQGNSWKPVRNSKASSFRPAEQQRRG